MQLGMLALVTEQPAFYILTFVALHRLPALLGVCSLPQDAVHGISSQQSRVQYRHLYIQVAGTRTTVDGVHEAISTHSDVLRSLCTMGCTIVYSHCLVLEQLQQGAVDCRVGDGGQLCLADGWCIVHTYLQCVCSWHARDAVVEASVHGNTVVAGDVLKAHSLDKGCFAHAIHVEVVKECIHLRLGL